jgi:hypothetical protein
LASPSIGTRLDGTLPRALTPAQQHAVTRTLADATHTSAELTQRASGELFHAAAAAFTDSLQLVAASAAVIPSCWPSSLERYCGGPG